MGEMEDWGGVGPTGPCTARNGEHVIWNYPTLALREFDGMFPHDLHLRKKRKRKTKIQKTIFSSQVSRSQGGMTVKPISIEYCTEVISIQCHTYLMYRTVCNELR